MHANSYLPPKRCVACNQVMPEDTLFIWMAWLLGKTVDMSAPAFCDSCVPRFIQPARTVRNSKSGSPVSVVTKRRVRVVKNDWRAK